MNKEPSIHHVLEQIERDAQDEFDQLADIGAELFPTAELLRLHGKWEEAYQTYLQLNKILLILGGLSPLWVILSFPVGLLGYLHLAYFIMGLFPATFILFAIGTYLLNRKYKSRNYLEFVGSLITGELRKRNFEKQMPRRKR